MKMSEAFTQCGALLKLIVPRRKNTITEDPFSYYGVTTRFPLLRLFTLDLVHLGKIGFVIQSLTFACSAARYIQIHPVDVIYGRDELVLWAISIFCKTPQVWESHTGSWNYFARSIAARAKSVVTISEGLKTFYLEKGVPEEKLVAAHDGIDLAVFADPESKEAARRRLNLPLTAKIALYAGRLDGWKGIEVLLEAARKMPGIQVVVIGGEADQVRSLAARYTEVRFLGYRPYKELANNLAAADMLVLPNTGKDPISSRFTSPLKLFAYMASRRPIVASDLPSLREVLHEDAAYFVEPDNVAALAVAILQGVENPLSIKKVQAARLAVNHYDWQERARTILKRISTHA
jgi:glycosyltransferase involved in cell wall biosynthesis